MKIRITSSQHKQIVSTLKKVGRNDLLKILADDLNTVTINDDSAKILDEKADGLIEKLEKMCEGEAEGDVECDLLKKHIIKKLTEKYNPTPEAEEGTEDAGEAGAEEVPQEEEGGEETTIED